MEFKIFAVEGISGAQKTEFCKLLYNKLEKDYPKCEYKSFIGSRNINYLRNHLTCNDKYDSNFLNLLNLTDFYQFFENDIILQTIMGTTSILERYLANLYAILMYNHGDINLLKIFNKYPAKVTMFIESDPEEAFESINARRAVSYWETNLSENIDPSEVYDDIIKFYRGYYSVDKIKEHFISYQTKIGKLILEYLKDKPHIIIDRLLSIDDKIEMALDHIKKYGQVESNYNYAVI